ncbi:hypothetical protein ACP4J5_08270 [Pseudomonas oryzihabitans]|uniref:hypothetical protein n=1 Tax=Pseudomonas oryzihabitans TaxID=47885 RepID=UPI003CEDA79B
MSNQASLSARYINALRQLPQYSCSTSNDGPLTHVITGVQVLPILADPGSNDDVGLLEICYLGGRTVEVYAHSFFGIALKEAAEIEMATSPEAFGISERKYTPVQLRVSDLREHLTRKHSLE